MNEVVDNTALKAAEAKFNATESLEDLKVLETVEKEYFAALIKAKAQWESMEISDKVRDYAEINANETEGTAGDELRWYLMAIGSVEFVDVSE